MCERDKGGGGWGKERGEGDRKRERGRENIGRSGKEGKEKKSENEIGGEREEVDVSAVQTPE